MLSSVCRVGEGDVWRGEVDEEENPDGTQCLYLFPRLLESPGSPRDDSCAPGSRAETRASAPGARGHPASSVRASTFLGKSHYDKRLGTEKKRSPRFRPSSCPFRTPSRFPAVPFRIVEPGTLRLLEQVLNPSTVLAIFAR